MLGNPRQLVGWLLFLSDRNGGKHGEHVGEKHVGKMVGKCFFFFLRWVELSWVRPLSPCCRSTRRSSKRHQKREIAPPSLQGFFSIFVRKKLGTSSLEGILLGDRPDPKDLDIWTLGHF